MVRDAIDLRNQINIDWNEAEVRRLIQIEEVRARLNLANTEGDDDAVEYTSRCLANMIANKKDVEIV